MVLAHRLAYKTKVGSVGQDEHLDHLCRNRPCVRWTHVEKVTPKVNVLRGDSPPAQNARKDRCTHGHPFDAKNTYYAKTGRRQCRSCTAQRMKDRYQNNPVARASNLRANADYVKRRMRDDPEFREKRRAYWRERGAYKRVSLREST